MTYNKYQITIGGINNLPKFIEVLAVDEKAAIADVNATYGEDVEIWSVWLV